MEKVSVPVAMRRSKTPVLKVYFQPGVVIACQHPYPIELGSAGERD